MALNMGRLLSISKELCDTRTRSRRWNDPAFYDDDMCVMYRASV